MCGTDLILFCRSTPLDLVQAGRGLGALPSEAHKTRASCVTLRKEPTAPAQRSEKCDLWVGCGKLGAN